MCSRLGRFFTPLRHLVRHGIAQPAHDIRRAVIPRSSAARRLQDEAHEHEHTPSVDNAVWSNEEHHRAVQVKLRDALQLELEAASWVRESNQFSRLLRRLSRELLWSVSDFVAERASYRAIAYLKPIAGRFAQLADAAAQIVRGDPDSLHEAILALLRISDADGLTIAQVAYAPALPSDRIEPWRSVQGARQRSHRARQDMLALLLRKWSEAAFSIERSLSPEDFNHLRAQVDNAMQRIDPLTRKAVERGVRYYEERYSRHLEEQKRADREHERRRAGARAEREAEQPDAAHRATVRAHQQHGQPREDVAHRRDVQHEVQQSSQHLGQSHAGEPTLQHQSPPTPPPQSHHTDPFADSHCVLDQSDGSSAASSSEHLAEPERRPQREIKQLRKQAPLPPPPRRINRKGPRADRHRVSGQANGSSDLIFPKPGSERLAEDLRPHQPISKPPSIGVDRMAQSRAAQSAASSSHGSRARIYTPPGSLQPSSKPPSVALSRMAQGRTAHSAAASSQSSGRGILTPSGSDTDGDTPSQWLPTPASSVSRTSR